MARVIGRRTVRTRAALWVAALVATPAIVVWTHDAIDATTVPRLEAEARAVAADARTRIDDPVALSNLAWRRGVRMTILSLDGEPLFAKDYDHLDAVGQAFGHAIFGPFDWPTLARLDATSDPVTQQPWFQTAVATGHVTACIDAYGGELVVCRAAHRVGDRVLVVEESSRRALRALSDARIQVLKLTLFALPVGLLFALALGQSLIGPLERLRDEVTDRAAKQDPSPLGWDRSDEFGELAGAFDRLIGTLEQRRLTHAAAVADLAHELKNPVAALAMAAEQLAAPLTDARRARLATVVTDSSARLDAVVSQFLELSRAEAGLPGRPRELIALADLARGLASRISAQHPDLEITVDAQPVTVLAVPERLEEAIANVLHNAASFARHQVTIEVVARQEAVIRITDDGPGVPPELLPQVFDRFVSRRAGGTGLGLAITKAVFEAHGGEASMAPGPAGGTVVTLRLPIA